MTRNAIPWLALLLCLPASALATADSPVVQGLGGAGRAGAAPAEAIFSNPASVGMLTQSGAFYFYQKPNIPQWGAGGRAYAAGVYDGQNPAAKGAFGFLRTSRARIGAGPSQAYEDRSEYRFAVGSELWSKVFGGLSARYVTHRSGANEEKYFNGDLGAIFPIYAGLLGALTYENLLEKPGEPPATAGAGLGYGLGYGIQAYADGYRFMKGLKKGERGWAVGAEAALAGSFRVRAGRFQEGLRRLKGWSGGLSWVGPRASFDYAYRVAGDNPKEKDHTLGIKVAF